MSTPPVVSTITVAGKTYSVTWSGDQRSNPNNKFLEDDYLVANLEWTKPVIRDNKGKVVSASFVYRVESTTTKWIDEATTVQNVNTTANKAKVPLTLNLLDDEIGLQSYVSIRVYATAVISKTSYQLGYSSLLNTNIGATSMLSFRQVFFSGSNSSSSPIYLNVDMSTALPYDAVEALSWQGWEQYVSSGQFSPVVQYREIGKPWKNAQIPSNSEMAYRRVNGYHSCAVSFDVVLPEATVNKVYEVRSALGVGNAVKTYIRKTFTTQPIYNNVIAVGDELVVPRYEDSQTADRYTLPQIIAQDGYMFSNSTRDGGTFYKTGAKIADLPALIRSIPKQPANAKTLLVVSIGLYDVAKVAPNKMISSVSFKATLKSALTAFLTNNPNATVALFPCPTFNTTVNVEQGSSSEPNQQNLADDYAAWLESNGTLIENAWNTNIPNILGTSTDQWIKDTATSKLSTYTSAMIQLVSELSTSTRKRVVMAGPILDPKLEIGVAQQFYGLDYLPKNRLTLGLYDYPLMANHGDANGYTALYSDGFHFNGYYVGNNVLHGWMENFSPVGWSRIGDVVYY